MRVLSVIFYFHLNKKRNKLYIIYHFVPNKEILVNFHDLKRAKFCSTKSLAFAASFPDTLFGTDNN